MRRSPRSARYGLTLLGSALAAFALYRVLIYYAEYTDETFPSFVVFVLYLVLLLGFTLGYLIYNRFLYRKGLTREQLPADWNDAEKDDFLADRDRRAARSRWMLFVIFALVFTFLLDAVDMFFIDNFLRK